MSQTIIFRGATQLRKEAEWPLCLIETERFKKMKERRRYEYVDVVVMIRDIIVIARKTRKKKGHVDDQHGYLSTRISLFLPRNNRLVLARSTRRFRRKMELSTREKIGRRVNTMRRIVPALFLRLYVRRKERIDRVSRDQDADD